MKNKKILIIFIPIGIILFLAWIFLSLSQLFEKVLRNLFKIFEVLRGMPAKLAPT